MLNMLKNMDLIVDIDSDRYTYNGINVPRVTTILSEMIFDQRLMYWSNSLGFKRLKYKEELDKAAYIGTKSHDAVEHLLSNKEFDIGFRYTDQISNAKDSFLLWWNMLNYNCKVQVINMEEKLSCPWFGGTYDILIDIDGKIWLIDLKTSNHIDYKYFLQLAAYRYMLYFCKNINIYGCIILQINKNEPMYNEYTLYFDNIDHYNFIEACTNEFFALVYAYYHKLYVKDLYNNIF